MKCEFIDREGNIQRYLNGDLSDAEMAAFEEHFLNCNECLEEMRDTLQLVEFIQNEGNHLFPEVQSSDKLKEKIISNAEFSSRLKFFRYLISPNRISFGVITVIIVLFLFLFYQSTTNVVTDQRITSNELNTGKSTDGLQPDNKNKESLIVDSKSDLIVSNFEESPNLEYLINQDIRSNYYIEIISPASEANVTDKIYFEIKYKSIEKLKLHIMDNRERVVLSPTINDSIFTIDVAEHELSPGLYYWKLESDAELLHIGKFYIKK